MATVGFHAGIGARPLDLNGLLIKRPSSTFFWLVEGDDAARLGVRHGDLLIVDRAERCRPDSLVLVTDAGATVLRPASRLKQVQPEDLTVWGVVTNIVHPLDDVVRRRLEPGVKEG